MSEDSEFEKALFRRARKFPQEFPGKNVDHYLGRYRALRSTFVENYQEYIDSALVLKEGILFTSHGPTHFKTVIDRAFEIIQGDPVPLTGYELYVLLIAIHLHDIGNLFGRKNHEKRCKDIIGDLGSLLSEDQLERRLFHDVAMAHGGTIDGNKDTIRSLRSKTLFKGQPIHIRKLAAILRLADELADDYSRVSGALIRQGIVDSVYHFYAAGLQTVKVLSLEARIELHFYFPKDRLLARQKKTERGKVWLFDEVLARCLKTFLEMRYASQYMRTINFDELYVRIEWQRGELDSPLEEVSFNFESLGFPDVTHLDVYELVPSLRDYASIGDLSGANISRHLRGANERSAKRTSGERPQGVKRAGRAS